jgi:alanine transaminase
MTTSQSNGEGSSSSGSHHAKPKTNGASNGSRGLRSSPSERVVTKDTINPAVIAAEYAVRGEIALRAEELREECSTDEGKKKLGFNEVISCNIGNPQQLGQKPITFFRQVRQTRYL